MTYGIKELLQLAAKACGIEVPEDGLWGGVSETWGVHEFNGDGSNFTRRWAPHIDDGDGARMEARLGITPDWSPLFVTAWAFRCRGWQSRAHFDDHNGDRQAARRMASLRVAAEVGRRMKCE